MTTYSSRQRLFIFLLGIAIAASADNLLKIFVEPTRALGNNYFLLWGFLLKGSGGGSTIIASIPIAIATFLGSLFVILLLDDNRPYMKGLLVGIAVALLKIKTYFALLLQQNISGSRPFLPDSQYHAFVMIITIMCSCLLAGIIAAELTKKDRLNAWLKTSLFGASPRLSIALNTLLGVAITFGTINILSTIEIFIQQQGPYAIWRMTALRILYPAAIYGIALFTGALFVVARRPDKPYRNSVLVVLGVGVYLFVAQALSYLSGVVGIQPHQPMLSIPTYDMPVYAISVLAIIVSGLLAPMIYVKSKSLRVALSNFVVKEEIYDETAPDKLGHHIEQQESHLELIDSENRGWQSVRAFAEDCIGIIVHPIETVNRLNVMASFKQVLIAMFITGYISVLAGSYWPQSATTKSLGMLIFILSVLSPPLIIVFIAAMTGTIHIAARWGIKRNQVTTDMFRRLLTVMVFAFAVSSVVLIPINAVAQLLGLISSQLSSALSGLTSFIDFTWTTFIGIIAICAVYSVKTVDAVKILALAFAIGFSGSLFFVCVFFVPTVAIINSL